LKMKLNTYYDSKEFQEDVSEDFEERDRICVHFERRPLDKNDAPDDMRRPSSINCQFTYVNGVDPVKRPLSKLKSFIIEHPRRTKNLLLKQRGKKYE
jgi:hypothetical protein